MSKRLKITSETCQGQNIDYSKNKIIYDSNYDSKTQNLETSNLILNNTNLITPIVNIIKDYNDDFTGKLQYILKLSQITGHENHKITYGIFSTFEKALIGLLSIAYTTEYAESKNRNLYNEKTGKWTFNLTSPSHNNTNQFSDPLIKVFMSFHKDDYDGNHNGDYDDYHYKNDYDDSYYIEEYKTNYLLPPEGEISYTWEHQELCGNQIIYQLKHGELYKDDVKMVHQPQIVVDWLDQLKAYINQKY